MFARLARECKHKNNIDEVSPTRMSLMTTWKQVNEASESLLDIYESRASYTCLASQKQ